MDGLLTSGIKRRIFISYHHKNDQYYCDKFRNIFGEQFEVFTDRSLNEPIRSDDTEYVNRKIREDYIKGSSITILLCGAETYKRKYVDWEIYSTLHHEHAVLGILLPTISKNLSDQLIVPDRFLENVSSGYAHFVHWDDYWKFYPTNINQHIETAIKISKNKSLIKNSSIKMVRNLS